MVLYGFVIDWQFYGTFNQWKFAVGYGQAIRKSIQATKLRFGKAKFVYGMTYTLYISLL